METNALTPPATNLPTASAVEDSNPRGPVQS